jgi:hypothetical protein
LKGLFSCGEELASSTGICSSAFVSVSTLMTIRRGRQFVAEWLRRSEYANSTASQGIAWNWLDPCISNLTNIPLITLALMKVKRPRRSRSCRA